MNYLICYAWKYSGDDYRFDNAITDKHPIEWLKEARKNKSCNYALTNYFEITKEQYDENVKEIN